MIRPYYVQISSWNYFWACITLLFTIVSTIMIVSRKSLFYENILFYLYCLIFVIATLFHDAENFLSAISSIGQIILAINVGVWVYGSKNKKNALLSIRTALILYLYLDVLCGILKIGQRMYGLEENYTFLALDNYAIFSIIPMLTIIFVIDSYLDGKVRINDWVCYGICFGYKVLTFSVNAIFCLFLLVLLYWIMDHFHYLRRLITVKNAVLVSIVLFIGIVFFDIHEILSPIMIAFGKGTTLNFRTVIWEHVITVFWSIPLFGYGRLSNGNFQNIVGLSATIDKAANHPHNFYLQLLFDVGFVGTIIYFFMLSQKLRFAQSIRNLATKRMAICGVVTFLIAGFLDGYPFTTMFYLLLGIIWSVSKWEKDQLELLMPK